MAPLNLLEMLHAAIGTPHKEAVDFKALRDLLKAMIGQLGQQELAVLEPGQSPTPSLGKEQDTAAQPGREKEEDGALGTGQQPQEPQEQLDRKDSLEETGSTSEVTSVAKEAIPKNMEEEERDVSKDKASIQDLWEEINKFKELQSGLAEDMRAMRESHSGLAEDVQAMQEAMQEAHSSMAEDIQAIQETLGLECRGGQSGPAEPTQLDMATQSRKSSALGPKGRGTQPGMKSSKGTPGSGSPGVQAGTQGEPVTPVKPSGTPSDHTRSCDASTTTPGMQPGAPGTQASTSGMQPGSPGTQGTTTPGMQPGAPGTQASTLGMQPGSPGTQGTTTPGMQPGAPGTQASTSGMQPGSPGTQGTTTPGMQPGAPGTQASTSGMQPGSLGTQGTTPLGTQPGALGTQASTSGMESGSLGTQGTTTPGTQPGAPGTQASTSGMEPGSSGTHPTTPGMQPGFSGSQATVPGNAQVLVKPWGSSSSTSTSSTSSHEAEICEALYQVGQLKEQVEQLKVGKAERVELENLHRLFPEGGRESITSILTNLQCQVSFLQDMARDLKREEEEEISKVEDAPRKMRGAGASRKADGSGQMTQQLRPKRQKVKTEQKELEKEQEPTQAELEQVAAEYVNKLVMDTAKQLQAELDESRETAQSGGQEHAGCPVCNSDIRVQLGKLLQRCEKLEEQVESLSQKAPGKVDSYPKLRRQSLLHDEVLKRIQGSIAQQQKDYEKFSSALANLQHDQQQEQKNIKALSQALGKLKKQKADKEELRLLGIDEKADKAALADKVSRSQFEACVERLNEMIEEVMSRVTGQEKAWHLFQQELQGEMDSKLDRRELGPFRQQLEERLKSLRGQLQEKALQPERDNAAGIRKQLLAGFHCLSCDRPLDMLAPGPEQTGECRYPTVPRSCGGPHTLTPPRFQPQPPSTPRRSPPSARGPNKQAAMQLLGQDGADGNRQDEQLSMMGGSQLSTQRGTPDTTISRTPTSTPSLLRQVLQHRPNALQHRPASSPGRLTLAQKLLPPIQPPRSESMP